MAPERVNPRHHEPPVWAVLSGVLLLGAAAWFGVGPVRAVERTNDPARQVVVPLQTRPLDHANAHDAEGPGR